MKKDKLQKAQQEDHEALTAEVVEEMTLEESMRAAEYVGAAKASGYFSQISGKFSIVTLKKIADEKLFQAYGFPSMAAFLDSQPHLPNHATFHRQVQLLEAEGEEAFNLLNSLNVPMSDRKWLSSGTIQIDGNVARVGDHQIDLGNSAGVKQLVKDLAAEIRDAKTQTEKDQSKIEKLEGQVKQGTEEYRELERNFDALNEGDIHSRSFTRAVNAMIQLRIEIEVRKFRPQEAEQYCQTLYDQFSMCRASYGLDRRDFIPTGTDLDDLGIDSIVNEVMSEDPIDDSEEV